VKTSPYSNRRDLSRRQRGLGCQARRPSSKAYSTVVDIDYGASVALDIPSPTTTDRSVPRITVPLSSAVFREGSVELFGFTGLVAVLTILSRLSTRDELVRNHCHSIHPTLGRTRFPLVFTYTHTRPLMTLATIGTCWLLLSAMILTCQTSFASSATKPKSQAKRLTLDTMYPGLRKMEYAVRGKVVIAADQISDNLASGKSYPFDHIVYTNIGNPQSVGQQPLTWPRQVLALVDLPDAVGIQHPDILRLFPADAVARAKEIKEGLGGHGSGAYSHSKGCRAFRRDIAAFLQDRDGGLPAEPEDIFMTNGASAGINMMLNALVADSSCGVMIPIPQYPIYSATIDLLGGQKVGYYLNEANGWELNMEELERSLQEATEQGIKVNAFVLINPGNPSGTVLSRTNLQDIVRFCAKHNLVLLADEVYQENVYDKNAEFVSCKRAAHEVGLLEDDGIELVSFHSISKGVFGECGRRGGYMELVGFNADVKDELYKLASANLCATVSGQIMTSLMVRGPDQGDVSYESHQAEKKAIFDSLRRRSKIVSDGLNNIPGISCQTATGSMYCFPSVEMPKGALPAAEKMGVSPDTLYCMSLLERTGLCVVPASGFGQREGRYGFRTTFLPSEDEMARAVEQIREHYHEFCEMYA
jgi:alanine transaminase